MAGFGAEIVSRDTIRPSSPTPSHLRIYNLSLLDQFSPLMYAPCTLFYSVNDTNSDPDKAVEQLQHSLSRTLSIFYPLAGRFRDDLSIDCNDEGVLFSVATVKLHLQEYLNNPDLDLLHHFTPKVEPVTPENLNSAAQVAVQVTLFSSGGLAIGVSFLHRVADASTMATFLRVWAGIASDGTMDYSTEIKSDHFMAASVHFPPLREKMGEEVMLLDMKWMRKKEKCVRSRVVFDAEAISALKAKASSEEDGLPNPTRFEVVTSLIWKHALAASISLNGSDADQHQPSMMMVAVNLRPRTEPPMDKNAIGSSVWLALAHQRNDTHAEISGVGGEIRRAVKTLGTDLVGDEGPHVAVKRLTKETKERYRDETPEVYVCSSWCSLPFYEADFGWGKPDWVAYPWRGFSGRVYTNSMVLMDNKSGNGVEAWLIFGESHTAKLLSDPEFLRFASVNPSAAIKLGKEECTLPSS